MRRDKETTLGGNVPSRPSAWSRWSASPRRRRSFHRACTIYALRLHGPAGRQGSIKGVAVCTMHRRREVMPDGKAQGKSKGPKEGDNAHPGRVGRAATQERVAAIG